MLTRRSLEKEKNKERGELILKIKRIRGKEEKDIFKKK